MTQGEIAQMCIRDRVKKSFTKPVKPAGTLYQEVSADEAVEIIVNKLKEKYII